MKTEIEKVFRAHDDDLAPASAFIEEQLDMAGCGMKEMMQISVAFEEIFVNVAHYAYPEKEGTMIVSLGIDDNMMRITFIDTGIPFDPLAKPDPDITLSAEERGIGGLGIYMVKKSMDKALCSLYD